MNDLQNIIDSSNNIVFFSGAGISTLSGLKDFRSSDGIYNQKYDYNPEEILSHTFFMNNTKYFFDFYKNTLNPLNYKPNIIHNYLSELEKKKNITVITQNIDNFHKLAGSKNVLELHGNVMDNYCMNCNKYYDGNYVFKQIGIPKCSCGGIIKPDVVLYEEELNYDILNQSIKKIKEADTLIVAGTSLNVYPAAGLIRYFNGKNLVLLNKDNTPYDYLATLVIHDDLRNVFNKLRQPE